MALKRNQVYKNKFNSEKLLILKKNNNTWDPVAESQIDSHTLEIDYDNLQRIITGSQRLNDFSLFKGIKILPPGFSLGINKSTEADDEIFFDWNSCTHTDVSMKDGAEILCEYISSVVKKHPGNTIYVVRFSGGLDSTGILLALAESVPISQIVALTYTFQCGSCKEDEIFSKNICSEMGIKNLFIEYDPKLLFNELDEQPLPIIDTAYVSGDFFKAECAFLRRKLKGDFIIFDGHGGDHVFCETIPDVLIGELARNLRPYDALNAALKLSRLEGRSFASVCGLNKKNLNFFQWFFKKDRKSVRKIRINTIEEAIFENSLDEMLFKNAEVYHPFTCLEMIKYGVNIDVYRSFNSEFRRLDYRKSINRKFDFRLSRINKGHITGAYQQAIRLKHDKTLDLIENGFLIKSRLFDAQDMIRNVEMVARGAGGFSVELMNFIIAELILKKVSNV